MLSANANTTLLTQWIYPSLDSSPRCNKFLKSLLACIVTFCGALFPLPSSADLMYSVDNGAAVYDATTNLTWIANMNLAATNSFGVSGIDSYGQMTWTTAESWIAAMNAANYLSYNNWSLPTTSTTSNCSGYLVCAPTSQMANLFYNGLGGVGGPLGNGGFNITDIHNSNFLLFNNFPTSPTYNVIYWSGTNGATWSNTTQTNVPEPWLAWSNWFYGIQPGYQDNFNISADLFALVVAPGNIYSSVTPSGVVSEPTGLALFGLGFLGLAGLVRRQLSTQ
jgi:hypothetical protein